ncbi:hypothetical protein [Micromonospora sp. WMMA1947]|nr:hypothetical protein [Micromonospora sp. WMMA1947]WBC08710.1 hypothetical protein O7604_26330 [Micromonospora sp. WMMA1947]
MPPTRRTNRPNTFAPTLDMACSPVHIVAARFGPEAFEDMLLNLRIVPAE